MPRPDYTSVIVLLDRSASMSMLREATVNGLNRFIQEQKEVPGDGDWTLYQFDDPESHASKSSLYYPTWARSPSNEERYQGQFPELVYAAVPQAKVKPLEVRQYQPRGSTALIDAACLAIDEAGRRFASMAECDRPAHVVFVIITDGLENASTHYKREDLRLRIFHQREKYSWQFVFLGANQDAIAEGQSYGIEEKTCGNFVPTTAGLTAGYNNVSGGLRSWKNEGCTVGSFHIDPGVPAGCTLPGTEPAANGTPK